MADQELKKMQQEVSREINRWALSSFPSGNYPINASESMKFSHMRVYQSHGKSACALIDTCAGMTGLEIKSILDFPCGHGRVMRSLRSQWPSARIVACDLDFKGVDFCVETFGAEPLYSNSNLEKNSIPEVDVVWIGSLLTHLDQESWSDIFDFAEAALNPGGILIATYAGGYVAELVRSGDHDHITENSARRALSDFENTGFGFMQYSTHKEKYGRTLTSYKWASEFVSSRKNLRPIMHFERGWAGRQNVLGLSKDNDFSITR